MVTAVIVLAVLLPVVSITAFIVGFNVNAPKKILTPPKKAPEKSKEQREIEEMLDFVENAKVYKTE